MRQTLLGGIAEQAGATLRRAALEQHLVIAQGGGP
jgi:hypothetical protein